MAVTSNHDSPPDWRGNDCAEGRWPPVLSKDLVTSAVASCAAPMSDAPLPTFGRAWAVLERTTQVPVGASAQGTRLPMLGSQLEPAGVGIARRMRSTNVHYLAMTNIPSTVPTSTVPTTTVPTTTKQLATTGADSGVIPGRTWSPPD